MDRRSFIKGSAMVAALAALPGSLALGARKPKTGMRQRMLGKNLRVSAIGLGCMGMSYGFGMPKDKKEMVKVIHKALDMGVNFFDTAEAYGPFINEELVGEAFQGRRNRVIIATKFGIRYEGGKQVVDSSLKGMRASLEGSLKRLKTDRIDLYYLHRVDPKVPIEDVAGLVSEFVKEGKVREWGLSEPGLETVRKAHAVLPLAALENQYHAMWRNPESELFPLLEKLNIGLVPFSPLNKGYLAGIFDENTVFCPKDLRPSFPWFQPENLKANMPVVDFLKKWGEAKNASAAQIALAWMMAQRPYIVPIPGTTNPAHLEENIAAAEIEFSTEELAQFNSELSKIKISGDRYPPELAARIGK